MRGAVFLFIALLASGCATTTTTHGPKIISWHVDLIVGDETLNCSGYGGGETLGGHARAAWNPTTPLTRELELVATTAGGVLARVSGPSPLELRLGPQPAASRQVDFTLQTPLNVSVPQEQRVALDYTVEIPAMNGAPGGGTANRCPRVN